MLKEDKIAFADDRRTWFKSRYLGGNTKFARNKDIINKWYGLFGKVDYYC